MSSPITGSKLPEPLSSDLHVTGSDFDKENKALTNDLNSGDFQGAISEADSISLDGGNDASVRTDASNLYNDLKNLQSNKPNSSAATVASDYNQLQTDAGSANTTSIFDKIIQDAGDLLPIESSPDSP